MQDWALRDSNDGQRCEADPLDDAGSVLWRPPPDATEQQTFLDTLFDGEDFDKEIDALFRMSMENMQLDNGYTDPTFFIKAQIEPTDETVAATADTTQKQEAIVPVVAESTPTAADPESNALDPMPTEQARPQLRIHVTKRKLESPDKVDPMQPRVDRHNLHRLAAATLRTLGLPITVTELERIVTDKPMPTNVETVPVIVLRVLTVMILGTSGDQDVSRTADSQITNGDLIALQNIIGTVLAEKGVQPFSPTATTLPSDASMGVVEKEETVNSDKVIDLSTQKYGPSPKAMPLYLRLYRFFVNALVSTPDSWPFVQPVPATATVYHDEIKQPMDLSTLERNVWRGKYSAFSMFERDLQLVWQNAQAFHRSSGSIWRHADSLKQLFYTLVKDVRRQMQKSQHQPADRCTRFDPGGALPETNMSSSSSEEIISSLRTIYVVTALLPTEPRALMIKENEKRLCTQFNGPFFDAVERQKQGVAEKHEPLPRFYIAKNRTLLRQVTNQGVLAVLYNTKIDRDQRQRVSRVRTSAVLVQPASEFFDLSQVNRFTDETAPKGWIHVRPLRLIDQIRFDINESIDREYFRRTFTTCKIPLTDNRTDAKLDETTRLLRKIAHILLHPDQPSPPPSTTPPVEPYTSLTTPPTIPLGIPVKRDAPENSEMAHEVWQRLLSECERKGVAVFNIEKYTDINWQEPHSEGLFKQVYFLPYSVVQTFREMTMYQRIVEVSCLMKLKHLPHMAQLQEVLYNSEGDIVGLSMERYHSTLKDFAHIHSHHRLSAHQKFDIVFQMLTCLKIIHEAGLGHRDLSEVNFMVNTIDGYLEDGSSKVCLYLIDFGKSVFCTAQDVRDWLAKVPRTILENEEGEDMVPQTEEQLDAWCDNLPWVKGKPDHGYRISIQTMPKTRQDNGVLPWLIHPLAEDMYSIGVMIWKVFTGTEPWRGIMDTDVQGLRYVAEDDFRIQHEVELEVQGATSRELLLKCLKTQPQERETAEEVLAWLNQADIRKKLIEEWGTYSSVTRASRKQKSVYMFDDADQRKKPNTSRSHGRSKVSAATASSTPEPLP